MGKYSQTQWSTQKQQSVFGLDTGIEGSKKANKVEKEGTLTSVIEPELFFGLGERHP